MFSEAELIQDLQSQSARAFELLYDNYRRCREPFAGFVYKSVEKYASLR
jgi:hypothetical protein